MGSALPVERNLYHHVRIEFDVAMDASELRCSIAVQVTPQRDVLQAASRGNVVVIVVAIGANIGVESRCRTDSAAAEYRVEAQTAGRARTGTDPGDPGFPRPADGPRAPVPAERHPSDREPRLASMSRHLTRVDEH